MKLFVLAFSLCAVDLSRKEQLMLSSGEAILSYHSVSVKFGLASLGTRGVAACRQTQRMSGPWQIEASQGREVLSPDLVCKAVFKLFMVCARNDSKVVYFCLRRRVGPGQNPGPASLVWKLLHWALNQNCVGHTCLCLWIRTPSAAV